MNDDLDLFQKKLDSLASSIPSFASTPSPDYHVTEVLKEDSGSNLDNLELEDAHTKEDLFIDDSHIDHNNILGTNMSEGFEEDIESKSNHEDELDDDIFSLDSREDDEEQMINSFDEHEEAIIENTEIPTDVKVVKVEESPSPISVQTSHLNKSSHSPLSSLFGAVDTPISPIDETLNNSNISEVPTPISTPGFSPDRLTSQNHSMSPVNLSNTFIDTLPSPVAASLTDVNNASPLPPLAPSPERRYVSPAVENLSVREGRESRGRRLDQRHHSDVSFDSDDDSNVGIASSSRSLSRSRSTSRRRPSVVGGFSEELMKTTQSRINDQLALDYRKSERDGSASRRQSWGGSSVCSDITTSSLKVSTASEHLLKTTAARLNESSEALNMRRSRESSPSPRRMSYSNISYDAYIPLNSDNSSVSDFSVPVMGPVTGPSEQILRTTGSRLNDMAYLEEMKAKKAAKVADEAKRAPSPSKNELANNSRASLYEPVAHAPHPPVSAPSEHLLRATKSRLSDIQELENRRNPPIVDPVYVSTHPPVSTPSDHILKTTMCRMLDIEELENKHKKKDLSKILNNIKPPSENLMRTTRSRIADVKEWENQIENAKYNDDIWWEKRKPLSTAKPDPNVTSKLFEPTVAAIFSKRDKYDQKSQSPSRIPTDSHIHIPVKIDNNSPLLRKTNSTIVQNWQVVKEKEKDHSKLPAKLTLVSQNSGPKVSSKLNESTASSRHHMWKKDEDENNNTSTLSTSSSKIKKTSDRLLSYNKAMINAKRTKVKLQKDPHVWQKLYRSDPIPDPVPIRSRSGSPSKLRNSFDDTHNDNQAGSPTSTISDLAGFNERLQEEFEVYERNNKIEEQFENNNESEEFIGDIEGEDYDDGSSVVTIPTNIQPNFAEENYL